MFVSLRSAKRRRNLPRPIVAHALMGASAVVGYNQVIPLTRSRKEPAIAGGQPFMVANRQLQSLWNKLAPPLKASPAADRGHVVISSSAACLYQTLGISTYSTHE